jgi:hypothetical protein
MELMENLCHGLYGTGDIYPNKDYNPYTSSDDYKRLREEAGDDLIKRAQAIQKTAPAVYFTCSEKADNITTFPCTGSKHKDGKYIVCSCKCHQEDPRPTDDELIVDINKLRR